jgi:hypothetical protein
MISHVFVLCLLLICQCVDDFDVVILASLMPHQNQAYFDLLVHFLCSKPDNDQNGLSFKVVMIFEPKQKEHVERHSETFERQLPE